VGSDARVPIDPAQIQAWTNNAEIEMPPSEILLELTTARRSHGARALWAGAIGGEPAISMPLDHARRALDAIREVWPDEPLGLTLAGRGDPVTHEGWVTLAQHAAKLNMVVHVRTDLIARAGEPLIEALLASGVDMISIDVLAHRPETYAKLQGVEALEHVWAGIDRLLALRTGDIGGLPVPWIVPRITRCDAVYEEVEPFYDTWVLKAGAACIDALPMSQAGQRIEPLPVPVSTARRLQRSRLTIVADGRVASDERALLSQSHERAGTATVIDGGWSDLETAASVRAMWSRVQAQRAQSWAGETRTHVEPPLWM
jgi:hypothetical protein